MANDVIRQKIMFNHEYSELENFLRNIAGLQFIKCCTLYC